MRLKNAIRELEEEKSLLTIDTAESYKALPEVERTKRVWYWPTPWYILPIHMESSGSLLDSIGKKYQGSGEWPKCFKFLKQEYPIQYFLREGLYDLKLSLLVSKIKWKLEDLSYGISSFFHPHQKWLTTVAGKRWRDKPELLVDVMYAFIIDYVEGEEALSIIDWNHSGTARKIKRNIQDIYDWAKVGRPKIEREIENCYDEQEALRVEANKQGLTGHEYINFVYGKQELLEKELSDTDSKYLKKIVDIRESLWT